MQDVGMDVIASLPMTGLDLETKVLDVGFAQVLGTRSQHVRSGALRVVRRGGGVDRQAWWKHPTRMVRAKKEKAKQRIFRKKEIK